jgi:hypothetical protein
MSKFNERIIKYQTDNTPAPDKLAHYFWGNRVWSKLGVLAAFLILILAKIIFVVNFWFLPLAFLPRVTATIAATAKEKRDSTGLGNSEKEDIKYTVMPSNFDVFYLAIIIVLLSF